MKSVYIADSYSLNTGDIGILIATISSIQSKAPGTKIYVEASHPAALKKYNLECDIFPRVLDISEIVGYKCHSLKATKATLIGLYDSATFLLSAFASRVRLPSLWMIRPSRRSQAKAIHESSVWLSSGGGYLSSFYRPELRFYGYLLALILRKPYVIFAQSVGPFVGKIHTGMARFFLNRAAAITIREDDSYRYMKAFGLKKQLHLTADIAFLLPATSSVARQKKRKAIAICVKKSNDQYNLIMHQAGKKLSDLGYYIYYISQTPNDDALAHDLQKQLGRNVTHIPFGMDARKLKALYADCELLIATRMHALIFAAEQNVPWVGIGYEPKFRGLSKQLGKTGILIEEKQLTSASMSQAIDVVLRRARPVVSPAQALTRKAQENTNTLLKILDSAN